MTAAFYILAAIMLLGGVGVVVIRNPVSAAFSLVLSFIGLAGLFITMNAYFIGTMQILVYAGAVMVLFLFIIMLFDIHEETKRKLNYYSFAAAFVLIFAFVMQFTSVLGKLEGGDRKMPKLDPGAGSDVTAVGNVIFTNYIFHLQIVGVLLLVATVGVVVLSKREAKKPSVPPEGQS